MDCLCCGGTGPQSDQEFLGSVCGLITADGMVAKFPVEPERYTLYVVAGCPFAARPWSVLGFYGLEGAIPIVKCFPASHEDGWFFEARSEGEHELVKSFPDAACDKDPLHGCHHLEQLYYRANKGFQGVVSVPLLWDSKSDTAVSNSSLGLAEMIATQMRSMGTRNQDVLLFPSSLDSPEEYKEHDTLVKMIHSNITTAVYRMNATKDGKLHDELVTEYYATLDSLQERLGKNGPFLMGNDIRFADMVLFISLVRLDLSYQWRFGLGRKNIREDYPGLLEYQRRIFDLPGLAGTVLPRDIMALYFMSHKWVNNAGRTLPQVPRAWEIAVLPGEK
jgi:putative glutathione S-transferase